MSGNDRPQNLTAGQYRALTVLLTGGSSEEAAAAAGVSGRTLRRWQLSAEFADALRSEARESFRQAHTQLLAAQADAVRVLRQAMRTGSPAEQIRAARTLLELGVKAGDDDLDERLERLEEALRSKDVRLQRLEEDERRRLQQLEEAWRTGEPNAQRGLRILKPS